MSIFSKKKNSWVTSKTYDFWKNTLYRHKTLPTKNISGPHHFYAFNWFLSNYHPTTNYWWTTFPPLTFFRCYRKLAGRTIFITGASRGIGKAIAVKAARDGANIVIAAKTAEAHPKLPGTIYSAAKEGNLWLSEKLS